MSKEFEDHYLNEICKFVYLQPEVSVSVEKIHRKFNHLTIDELREILVGLEKNLYIKLLPVSNLNYQIVGEEKTTRGTDFTSVNLLMKGTEIAEYNRKMYMKSLRLLFTQPLVNSIISFIVGFIAALIVKSFL